MWFPVIGYWAFAVADILVLLPPSPVAVAVIIALAHRPNSSCVLRVHKAVSLARAESTCPGVIAPFRSNGQIEKTVYATLISASYGACGALEN